MADHHTQKRHVARGCRRGNDQPQAVVRFDPDTFEAIRQRAIAERTSFAEQVRTLIAARGRVLITGLGLGCVVRGLLASPWIDWIDVVEIDADILRVVGPEFAGDPRIRLHHGDALTINLPGSWDFAWHDLWTDGDQPHLQCIHAKLFVRYARRARRQGAWAFPRYMTRLMPWRPLGAPRSRRMPLSRRRHA